MEQPLLVRIRRELYGKQGLILLNAALIVEAGMTFLSNNHVCLIKTDQKSQKQRLAQRNLNDEQIQRRLDSQYTFQEKLKSLQELIKTENFGHSWVIDNSAQASQEEISDKFTQIADYFGLK
jgi:dephospho-CoA kinase